MEKEKTLNGVCPHCKVDNGPPKEIVIRGEVKPVEQVIPGNFTVCPRCGTIGLIDNDLKIVIPSQADFKKATLQDSMGVMNMINYSQYIKNKVRYN